MGWNNPRVMKMVTVVVDGSEICFDIDYMAPQDKVTDSGIPVTGFVTNHGTFEIKVRYGDYEPREVTLERLRENPYIMMVHRSAVSMDDAFKYNLLPATPYIENPYRIFPTFNTNNINNNIIVF